MIKKLELLANLAIIAIVLLLGIVLAKQYLLRSTPPALPAAPAEARILPGTKLELPGIDWTQSQQTLVLVLSEGCRYCTESAGFYQRLAKEKAKGEGSPRLIAVLPQEVGQGQAYLNQLGVAVDEVRQSRMSAIGVRGTPTLILVDNQGAVKESWLGKLSEATEADVMARLRVERASN
jgi:hypothetical protein